LPKTQFSFAKDQLVSQPDKKMINNQRNILIVYDELVYSKVQAMHHKKFIRLSAR